MLLVGSVRSREIGKGGRGGGIEERLLEVRKFVFGGKKNVQALNNDTQLSVVSED